VGCLIEVQLKFEADSLETDSLEPQRFGSDKGRHC